MGGIIKVNLVVVMAIMLACMQFHGTVAQTTHVVGDAFGWNIPAAGESDYATWASRQTFTVGDFLLFNFTGGHTVAEVAEGAYGTCNTATLMSLATGGPARLTLNTPGAHYFICTVGTHCQLGQKLSVNVVAAGGSAAPAPAPTAAIPPPTTTVVPPPTATPSPAGSATPPPTGGATPIPTGGTTPPPPADSFAPSFTSAVPVTMLAMALALFY